MKYLIFLALFVGLTFANPQGHGIPAALQRGEKAIQALKNLPPPVVCENGKLTPHETLFKALENCTNPDVYGEGEDKMDKNCSVWCQARILGMLNEHGVPTKELYRKFMTTKIPKEYQSKMLNYMFQCFDKHVEKIKVFDETCEGAAEFFNCTWEFNKLDC